MVASLKDVKKTYSATLKLTLNSDSNNLSQTAPARHPLRAITTRVDPVLPKCSPPFDELHADSRLSSFLPDQAPEVRTLTGISLAGKPRGVSRNQSVLRSRAEPASTTGGPERSNRIAFRCAKTHP
jgi:hypothetical protein